MNYLTFILSNPRFLGYGFMMLFFSSFGQTYFIAEYIGELQAEFDLSHSGIGFYFSGSTLVAGLLMAWVGRKIDEFDLRAFTAFICLGLIVGCFVMTLAQSVLFLFFGLLLLRLSGQGLMMHASLTSMARYFDKERGKATSIASMGMSAAQLIFPYIAFTLVMTFGWRQAWEYSGYFLALFLMPLMLWLLTGHGERHERFLAEGEEGRETAAAGGDDDKGWARRVLFRDPRYYMIMPLALAVPFLLTGLMFHRIHITNLKGWPDDALPLAFMVFSGVSWISSIVSGQLVDKYGVAKFFPMNQVPIVMGLLCLVFFDVTLSAYFYMGLCGLGLGISIPVNGTLWPQMFGARHIGTVRAINSSMFMISTALAPFFMGWLFDMGTSVEALALGGSIYMIATIILARSMVMRYGLGHTETVSR